MKSSDIKPNPKNPRIIKDDKFKKLVQSLKDFPEMAAVRPVVINEHNVILGGNMRYKAMLEAGWDDIPVTQVKGWTKEQEQEFIIKDNVSGGEWDWDVLANEWDAELLDDWGLDLPTYEEPPVDLATEDPEFTQITFTLHNDQKQTVLDAIEKARNYITGDEMNTNTNGNGLYYVAKQFIED